MSVYTLTLGLGLNFLPSNAVAVLNPPPADIGAVLLESGEGFVELEDGSGVVLLE